MHFLAAYKEIVLVAAFVAWCVAVRTKRKPWFWWLGAQLALALAAEYAGRWLGERGIPNQWLYNGYMLGEHIALLMVVFYMGRELIRALPYVLVFALVLFLAAFIRDLTAAGTFGVFASNGLVVGGFLIGTSAALVMLAMAFRGPLRVTAEPRFWILLALVSYFLCTAPLFGLYNRLSAESPEIGLKIYQLNDLLFVMRYGLTAFGLIHEARRGGHE